MSKEYLDAIHSETDKLMKISKQLIKLSNAFYTTGNYPLGEQLEIMSLAVLESQSNIGKAVNNELQTQYKNSQQASVNMLNAALAGSGSKELVS
jgi:hypothetical protein